MLLSLHIKNFAIITESEVEFGDGMNVLTGETGAGKSILIGAVNMALGAKISKDMIRNGADYALSELIFDTDDKAVDDKLAALGIEQEGGQVIISRKIMSSGRNIFKINGENVTVSAIKEVAGLLLDVHGQHEHQSLLNKHKHLEFVDRYAGNRTFELKSIIADLYRQYTDLLKKLETADIDDEARARQISFMDYEINEIEEANLKNGEDDALEERFKLLSNARNICEGVEEARECIFGDNESISGLCGRLVKTFSKLAQYDDELKNFYERMTELEALYDDLGRDIDSYADKFENSSEEFEAVAERLDLINKLKLKYGRTIKDIHNYKEERVQEREKLIKHEEYVEDLKKQLDRCISELKKNSGMLSKIRKEYAKGLCDKVKAALIDLNFLDVRFDIRFEETGRFGPDGTDEVQFYISTNPGEELMPLIKIASGGEMSRIMLAIKSVLADKDEIGALIFDEIDVGISGRTAQKVSEKMAVISKNHQVICITHLPQIAAMADTHFLIEKGTFDGKVKTEIKRLSQDEEVKEIARMLSGAEITDTVLESAREMKQLADRQKEQFQQIY